MKNAQELALQLAQNVTYLRKIRGLSQDQLARMSEIPRTTISHIESGSGNPTLTNLIKLSGALQVSLEELLSESNHEVKIYHGKDLVELKKGIGNIVLVKKLLPDKIPGLEIEILEFEPGAKFKGSPHIANTKEYLYCHKGEVGLTIEQENFSLKEGDLISFKGDVKHSYQNLNDLKQAICFSVVSFVPLHLSKN